MQTPIVAALVAAGLLAARLVRAEGPGGDSPQGDPCAEDVKQLCADVLVGGGRVRDCLRKNEAALSPACRSKRAAADARFRAVVEEFARACNRDAQQLCSHVKAGGGRVVACLSRQLDDLSGSCRPAVERVQAAAETVRTMRAVCAAEATRLCGGAPAEAGPLVDCLQANRAQLSDTCGSIDPDAAVAAAELVDAVDALSSQEQAQEALQILQGIESVAFSRSQILFQVDHYQGLGGTANGNRLLFNPQLAFGSQREFAIQLRAPVVALYPYAPEKPAQTGLGAVTTSLTWAFWRSTRVRQYAALGLQWISPVDPPIGGAWAVNSGYAISVGVVRGLSVTGQVAWSRSFGSSNHPEVNILLVDPIVVVNLPGRSFFALDTRLGWNLAAGSFLPVIKGIAGIYIDRRKSLSVSAWYQTALTKEASTQTFRFGVGTALAYFFDW